MSLTAVILTLNEAHHIADCIASVAWADAIIVLDSLSEDGTAEIARQAGATVYTAPFENYAAQRNIALGHVQTDWVLFVDADERVTAELAAEIRHVMATRPEAGWSIPRHNYIFGKLTLGAGWYPDYQARLFRTTAVRYDRPVHEVAVVQGEMGHLQNPLIHHNYTDPAHFHRKQTQYTAYDAQILRQQGVRLKVYTPYTQPLRHFWWRFVTLAGYKDGLHGLRLSLYLAYYEWRKYRLVKDF
jgi:(heptosyl)LPS beta-1,4-glucosyltransferase